MKATFVCKVPRSKVNPATGWPSIRNIVSGGKAPDCIIFRRFLPQLSPGGFRVVLFDDIEPWEADGVKVVPTAIAGNNQQRYDVYFTDAVQVTYKPEIVYRNGGTNVI